MKKNIDDIKWNPSRGQCPLCGMPFDFLSRNHIENLHNLDFEKFLEEYPQMKQYILSGFKGKDIFYNANRE